jgi:hypothetical protein
MDINQQNAPPTPQPPVPIQWTWIAQYQESNSKAVSIWKLGFIAPDGAEVRVTFHQVGDVAGQQAQKQQEQQAQAAQSMQMGMPPSPDPTSFAPAGQPNTDQTSDATFYVTFFSNRHPEFFMKWDISLSHEDSLTVWVTITHGIIDFIRKAQPANVILDDLSNGKLKMILRSVAMDVAAANPGYELEQTQKHHYRSFYQVKKTGTQSAFDQSVAGNKNIEGDTQPETQASPVTGGQAQVQAQSKQMGAGSANEPQPIAHAPVEAGDAPTSNQGASDEPQGNEKQEDPNNPAFQSADEIPIKQTPSPKRGLTVEIGKDYSIAVKDNGGNVIDRYRAKGPMDILRWLNEKGYGANKMKIVDKEQPGNGKELVPDRAEKSDRASSQMMPQGNAVNQVENFVVTGSAVLMKEKIKAVDAAKMNLIVNATTVRLVDEGVEFVFESDKDMHFKKALVELAAKKNFLIRSYSD